MTCLFALLVLLLTAIGVLMVFSASFARAFYEAEDPSAMAALSVFLRQAVFAAAGVVVMFITSKIDYHWWRRWAVLLLGLTILLLLAVIVLPLSYRHHIQRCYPLAECGLYHVPAVRSGKVCGYPVFCRDHQCEKRIKWKRCRMASSPISWSWA